MSRQEHWDRITGFLLRCCVVNAEFHQGLFCHKHFALLLVGSKTRDDGRDALVCEFLCSREEEIARNKNFL